MLHGYIATLHFEEEEQTIILRCTSEAPLDKEQVDNQIHESFEKALWGLEEVTPAAVGRFLAREIKNVFPFMCEVEILNADTAFFVSSEEND